MVNCLDIHHVLWFFQKSHAGRQAPRLPYNSETDAVVFPRFARENTLNLYNFFILYTSIY